MWQQQNMVPPLPVAHEIGLEVLLPCGTHMAIPRDSQLRRDGSGLNIFKIAASPKVVWGPLEIKLASHGFSGIVEKGRYLFVVMHIHTYMLMYVKKIHIIHVYTHTHIYGKRTWAFLITFQFWCLPSQICEVSEIWCLCTYLFKY